MSLVLKLGPDQPRMMPTGAGPKVQVATGPAAIREAGPSMLACWHGPLLLPLPCDAPRPRVCFPLQHAASASSPGWLLSSRVMQRTPTCYCLFLLAYVEKWPTRFSIFLLLPRDVDHAGPSLPSFIPSPLAAGPSLPFSFPSRFVSFSCQRGGCQAEGIAARFHAKVTYRVDFHSFSHVKATLCRVPCPYCQTSIHALPPM